MTKKELVYVLLCQRRLSIGWRSQGRRRCCTPSSDAPAKPSPYYLKTQTTLSQMEWHNMFSTISATLLSQTTQTQSHFFDLLHFPQKNISAPYPSCSLCYKGWACSLISEEFTSRDPNQYCVRPPLNSFYSFMFTKKPQSFPKTVGHYSFQQMLV